MNSDVQKGFLAYSFDFKSPFLFLSGSYSCNHRYMTEICLD
ncbi:hypothetical protein LptCag_0052 [Leptospirillum ferriphilum]|uniref:Uncharacterized protein n=1 Tax=Leptospirillum ferriphilum TaxID=178606 RepID=A0A094X4D7_9BACT|nr:hypothetical protein LptCag_0052 [Leptospirillum ferriphilum]